MRTLIAALTGACAFSLATGCGTSEPENSGGTVGPTLPATTTTATAPNTADAGAKVNDRGYIPKKLGEEAGLTPGQDRNDPGTVKFVVDKVEVDPSCHEYGMKPENGHTLLLHMRVATGNNREYAEGSSGIFQATNFVEIGKDGISHPARYGECTDYAQRLPDNFGMNQRYVGTVELVVPEASGTIVLALPGGMNNTSGWEWRY